MTPFVDVHIRNSDVSTDRGQAQFLPTPSVSTSSGRPRVRQRRLYESACTMGYGFTPRGSFLSAAPKEGSCGGKKQTEKIFDSGYGRYLLLVDGICPLTFNTTKVSTVRNAC